MKDNVRKKGIIWFLVSLPAMIVFLMNASKGADVYFYDVIFIPIYFTFAIWGIYQLVFSMFYRIKITDDFIIIVSIYGKRVINFNDVDQFLYNKKSTIYNKVLIISKGKKTLVITKYWRELIELIRKNSNVNYEKVARYTKYRKDLSTYTKEIVSRIYGGLICLTIITLFCTVFCLVNILFNRAYIDASIFMFLLTVVCVLIDLYFYIRTKKLIYRAFNIECKEEKVSFTLERTEQGFELTNLGSLNKYIICLSDIKEISFRKNVIVVLLWTKQLIYFPREKQVEGLFH